MIIKKWLLTTGMAMSLSILGSCAQTDDDSVEEPDQEETDRTEDTASDEQTSGEGNEQTSESENEENQDEETNEPTSENNDTSGSNSSDSSDTKRNEEAGQTDAGESDAPQLDLEDDILNPASIAVLINKQYSLPEDYTPENLVTVEVPTVVEGLERNQMRAEAANSLQVFFADAKQEGHFLYHLSGYRSYSRQNTIFSNNVEKDGLEKASRYSAKPGESEHQSGLSVDITSEAVSFSLTAEFGETSEGIWVKENAHKYGFIIRYPKGKTGITGYVYEPWHLRYLGIELATDIYESGLTYEEYLIERGFDIKI